MENESNAAFEDAIQLYDYALKKYFLNEEDKALPLEELYTIIKNIRD